MHSFPESVWSWNITWKVRRPGQGTVQCVVPLLWYSVWHHCSTDHCVLKLNRFNLAIHVSKVGTGWILVHVWELWLYRSQPTDQLLYNHPVRFSLLDHRRHSHQCERHYIGIGFPYPLCWFIYIPWQSLWMHSYLLDCIKFVYDLSHFFAFYILGPFLHLL